MTRLLGTGFGADDGASLLMAFRGLQAESAAQGAVHLAIAKELHALVADPFEEWARGYKVCNLTPVRVYLFLIRRATGAPQAEKNNHS